MKTIVSTDIRNWPELEKAVRHVSERNPEKYVTFAQSLGTVWIYVHDRKPGGRDTHGAEATWRRFGGFLRNGDVVPPAPSLVRQWERVPILK